MTDYAKVQAIVEKTVPDLDYVAARGRGWARLVSDQGAACRWAWPRWTWPTSRACPRC